jgi:hypothetical protein
MGKGYAANKNSRGSMENGSWSYKKLSKSSDKGLKQHGGEGRNLSSKNDMKLNGQGSEVGSARNLKVMS